MRRRHAGAGVGLVASTDGGQDVRTGTCDIDEIPVTGESRAAILTVRRPHGQHAGQGCRIGHACIAIVSRYRHHDHVTPDSFGHRLGQQSGRLATPERKVHDAHARCRGCPDARRDVFDTARAIAAKDLDGQHANTVGNSGEADAVIAGSTDRARHVGTMSHLVVGCPTRSNQIESGLDARTAQVLVARLDARVDDTDGHGSSAPCPPPGRLCPDARVSPAVDEARIIGIAKSRQNAQGCRHRRCRKALEPIADGPFRPEDARPSGERSQGFFRRAAFRGTNPLPTGCDHLATGQRDITARLHEQRLGAGTLRTYGQQGGCLRALDTACGGHCDTRDEETTETGTNGDENLRVGSTHPACTGLLAATFPRCHASLKPQAKRARPPVVRARRETATSRSRPIRTRHRPARPLPQKQSRPRPWDGTKTRSRRRRRH